MRPAVTGKSDSVAWSKHACPASIQENLVHAAAVLRTATRVAKPFWSLMTTISPLTSNNVSADYAHSKAPVRVSLRTLAQAVTMCFGS